MNITACIHKLGLATLWRLPPESAHNLAVWALKSGLVPESKTQMQRKLAEGVFKTAELPGVGPLAHPICLAAGFDKNAETAQNLHKLGFSTAEYGTVTPQPQAGNMKPRLFRLKEQRALINRMGFNNSGINQFVRNVAAAKRRDKMKIGINVGKNKVTLQEKSVDDYLFCLDKTKSLADYFVANISSPNTQGLRDLGSQTFLSDLENGIDPEQLKKTYIKIDPDRPKQNFVKLIEMISKTNFAGIILSNTSATAYPEKGGLSGAPLMSTSNRSLEVAYEVHQGSMPTIASGGVLSGRDVLEKIMRGADAVQIYTAMVYRGAGVVDLLLEELWLAMRNAGFQSLAEARGALVRS